MPGFNGTGPRGEGPLTGGRRGLCRAPKEDGVSLPLGVGRGGRPRGGGRGQCYGGGRGRSGFSRGEEPEGFAAPPSGNREGR